MIVLYVVAGIAEVVGLLLALHGFRRTWAEFGSTDHGLRQAVIAPMAGLTQRLVDQLEARLRSLLGRPRNVTIHASTVESISLVDRPSVRVTFGPLPSITDDPEMFAVEVHRRVQDIHEKAQGAQEAAQSEAVARDAVMKALQRKLDDTTREMESMSRTIAVGGLVGQIYGWMFIFIGTALGTLGNIIEAATSRS